MENDKLREHNHLLKLHSESYDYGIEFEHVTIALRFVSFCYLGHHNYSFQERCTHSWRFLSQPEQFPARLYFRVSILSISGTLYHINLSINLNNLPILFIAVNTVNYRLCILNLRYIILLCSMKVLQGKVEKDRVYGILSLINTQVYVYLSSNSAF